MRLALQATCLKSRYGSLGKKTEHWVIAGNTHVFCHLACTPLHNKVTACCFIVPPQGCMLSGGLAPLSPAQLQLRVLCRPQAKTQCCLCLLSSNQRAASQQ